MPELPEVEIVRRNLTRWTVGRTVTAVTLDDPGALAAPAEALVGRRVLAWGRRGKLLLGELDGGLGLVSHLGMTGKWVREPGPRPPRPFVRLTLSFDDGLRVGLVDVRRLGWTRLIHGHPADAPEVRALGPDPLTDGLTGATLRQRLGRGRAPLKARLLDQARVAGLGNICALEACFRAGLHPHTPVDAVPEGRWDALAAGALAHIADTLDAEDGDEVAYVNEGGANRFAVYGHAGAPCPRCAAPIARAALAGRPSFYCPTCQPPPAEP